MSQAETASIQVARWPSERPLFVLIVLAAIGVWAALVLSLFGIVYVALLAVFFFVAHLTFITHLRGNGVRLGPDQMPELYARVVELSRQIGLAKVPEAYVVQAGGVLNALATRFLRANVLVLFSDLLEACGDNREARDFIVAHELGHLHAGHLRGRWLILPGLFVPFLGTAWSRACEYTCDRYGMAASTNPTRALDGLCVLAAGGEHGPRLNRAALVAQRADLNSAFMKIGVWLSTHPPIASRLAVLDPSLGPPIPSRGASLRALALIALAVGIPSTAAFGAVWKLWPQLQARLAQQGATGGAAAGEAAAQDPATTHEEYAAHVQAGILSLVEAAERFRAERGQLPASRAELYEFWATLHTGESEPQDPWNSGRYLYELDGDHYVIRSKGPDLFPSADDLYYSSRAATEGP